MGRTQVTQLLSLVLVIVLLPVFTGCGSVNGAAVFNPSPTPTPIISPTPTPSPTPLVVSRFIYGTPGFESGTIQAGAILGDGSVSPVVGSPFGEGLGQPSVIQVTGDSRGRFVYVLNVEASAVGMLIGTPGIAGFKVDRQTGALTTVPGSPIIFPVRNDNLITLDGLGHFLFEPNGQGNLASTGFDVYLVDQNTGALTKTTSTSNAPPVGSFSVASADGQFLFNAGNGLVQAFSIVSPTGQLLAVPGTPLPTAGSAPSQQALMGNFCTWPTRMKVRLRCSPSARVARSVRSADHRLPSILERNPLRSRPMENSCTLLHSLQPSTGPIKPSKVMP